MIHKSNPANPFGRSQRGPWPARHGHARGFTALEVLIAMGIMFVGAAAVMTMQKTSIQSNTDARKADVASSIARTWVERIRHETMRWTQPFIAIGASNMPAGLTNHIGTGWFRPSDDMIAAEGTPGTVETMSYAFDILGRDLAQADVASNAVFCAEARITTLASTPTDGGPPLGLLYRLDVRVVWPRGINTVPNAASSTALSGSNWPCSDNTVHFPDALDYTLFHAINVSTAISENPVE